MSALLQKMRGDRRGWYKVSALTPGVEIAVPSDTGELAWDEIVSITPVGRERVYDIEVEGTRNFVGNGIFAHNTYILRSNTTLVAEGVVVRMPSPPLLSGLATSTATLAEIPPEVLTADGAGVDLLKLAAYNFAVGHTLASRLDASDVRLTSLESRVSALESGAVSSGDGSPLSFSTSTLASALEGFDILIQKGVAQFKTLVFRQLVASSDADGTSSAGSATILTGNTVAQVTNSLVRPSTKIFVTFNASVVGSWWVSDKVDGSFRVVLSEPQAGDVSFDYFLVQTEGQIDTSSSGSAPSVSQGSGSSATMPSVTVLGDNPLHLSVGGTFVEPGVTVGGSASTYTTYINGVEQVADASTIDTANATTYIITYKAVDASGNVATAHRSVVVGNPDGSTGAGAASGASGGSATPTTGTSSDTVAPVVTLVGDAAVQLSQGATFTDPGASAADETDGTLAVTVSGSVDTNTPGLYTLTYSATDASGNTGSASRVVTVVP